jgi:hypothetical protein
VSRGMASPGLQVRASRNRPRDQLEESARPPTVGDVETAHNADRTILRMDYPR